jgi:hypothetical protein
LYLKIFILPGKAGGLFHAKAPTETPPSESGGVVYVNPDFSGITIKLGSY